MWSKTGWWGSQRKGGCCVKIEDILLHSSLWWCSYVIRQDTNSQIKDVMELELCAKMFVQGNHGRNVEVFVYQDLRWNVKFQSYETLNCKPQLLRIITWKPTLILLLLLLLLSINNYLAKGCFSQLCAFARF